MRSRTRGNRGGGDKPSLPVVFENGEWASELGEVKSAIEEEGGAGDSMSITDGNIAFRGTVQYSFIFAEPVDASAYSKLVFEIKGNDSDYGYWAGGKLFSYYDKGYEDDNGETSYAVGYGFWGFDYAGGKMNYVFANAVEGDLEEAGPFDKTKFYGFSFKAAGGAATITKITLE